MSQTSNCYDAWIKNPEGRSMRPYSKLLLAILFFILFVSPVVGEPPENGPYVEYHDNGKKAAEGHYKSGLVLGADRVHLVSI